MKGYDFPCPGLVRGGFVTLGLVRYFLLSVNIQLKMK